MYLKNRLGLIIPYRDRKEHLDIFIPIIKKHLKSQNIDYKIIVVEQCNKNPFNRSKLMNIGAKYIYDEIDYLCFHDVDLIPDTDVDYNIYSKDIIHLCGYLIENRDNIIKNNKYKYIDYIKRKLLGGVTLIRKEIWKKHQWNEIFEGWGEEDCEYWYRLEYYDYNIDSLDSKYISLSHKSNSKKLKNSFYLKIARFIFLELKNIYINKLPLDNNLVKISDKYELIIKSEKNDYDLIKVNFEKIKYNNNIVIYSYLYHIFKLLKKILKILIGIYLLYLIYENLIDLL